MLYVGETEAQNVTQFKELLLNHIQAAYSKIIP
jgi:hypothetical protein